MADTTVRKAKVCRPTICWYRRTSSSSGDTSSARGAMRSTTHRLIQQATKKVPTNVAASPSLVSTMARQTIVK